MEHRVSLTDFARAQGFQVSDSVPSGAACADHVTSSKSGVLCGLLDVMDNVSKEERAAQDAQLELDRLELDRKYAETVSSNVIRKRTAAAESLADHLGELVGLDRSELLRRIEAPFVESHLAIEESAHEDMVAVVRQAFADVCNIKEDLDVAAWTQSANLSLHDVEDLVASRANVTAKIERHRTAVLEAWNAMSELENASSVHRKGTLA